MALLIAFLVAFGVFCLAFFLLSLIAGEGPE